MADALAVTTITNVPPDRYERIQQAAEEQVGIGLTGNAGTIEDKGVTLTYAYDGKSLLTLAVQKVPSITVFKHEHDLISPQAVISRVEIALRGIA